MATFSRSTLQIAFASALLLVLVGLGLWTYRTFRQSDTQQAAGQPSPGNVESAGSRQTPDQSALAAPSPGEQAASSTPASTPQAGTPDEKRGSTPEAPEIVALLLVPGSHRRAGGANELIIPPQAQTVRLQLPIENTDHREYRAVLRSVDGKEIFKRPGLKVQASGLRSFVMVVAPAAAFPAGDFLLTLGGRTRYGLVEDLDKYFISVRRK